MKKLVLFATLTAMGLATQAMAEVDDADGNGTFSLAEMQAAYPALTEELFVALDLDESGELSAEELNAAMEAESLPK